MKECSRCKLIKVDSAFSYKDKSKGSLNPYCRECNQEYQKRHYLLNREYYAHKRDVYNNSVLTSNRKKVIEFLQTHPCTDCGESDILVLEFDHVRGEKREAISNLLTKSASWKSISTEIEKCEVRCANCHKRRTAKQFGWYKSIN